VNIRLAYGKTGLDVSLPDGWKVDIVRPKPVEALADPAGAVREACRHPIGSRPLRELVKPSDSVALVCNDITRPTPYRTILPVLLDEVGHIPDEAVVLLIATGTHRANTPDELRTMLGRQIADRFRVVQNDAHDRDSHALVGTTANGNEIWIHKEFLRCDVRILTGFIEPHFFAGFSGGGKAVMPGLALLETILSNHRARNIDHPQAASCVSDGNPVWEGIREAAVIANRSSLASGLSSDEQPATGDERTFLLNVALNHDQQITAVFAGDMEQAHRRGCSFVGRHAATQVDAPYDVVLASNCGYPLDQNLYQSVKGMSAAAGIVKKGGAIIVAADCCDGIPDHGEYKRLLFESAGPAALLRRIRAGDYACQDAWQAHIQALVCEKADVYLFSHNLTDEQITRAMLKPCRDIAGTVARLLRSRGREALIGVLPEGPQTIPYVTK
jgi:nickel-dependent lactate racemase